MEVTATMIADIYAATAIGVGVILAAAGMGSAIGWVLSVLKHWKGLLVNQKCVLH